MCKYRVRTHDKALEFCHNGRVSRNKPLSLVFTRRLPTSSVQSQSLISRIFEQAFNQGNLAIVDELVAVNCVTHSLPWGLPTGRRGLKQLIIMFRTAFPDLHCTVEDEINEGHKSAAHWTMCGTHQGPFLGNPPTGRPIAVQGIIFARIENERIAEDWILVDQMDLLQQLGIVPPPRDARVRYKD